MHRSRFGPLCLLVWAAGVCQAAPQVQNGGFEADRYTKSPGAAGMNGRVLTGWTWAGNAGVNPVWQEPKEQRGPDSPFWDNGAAPEGKQIALIQGPGKLAQSVGGFVKGKRYRVTYRENARVQRRGDEWPRVRVMLGGQVVVSPHEVAPVGRAGDFSVPFYRVESGDFTAPGDGLFGLLIEAVQQTATTTILLDDVRIVEVD